MRERRPFKGPDLSVVIARADRICTSSSDKGLEAIQCMSTLWGQPARALATAPAPMVSGSGPFNLNKKILKKGAF